MSNYTIPPIPQTSKELCELLEQISSLLEVAYYGAKDVTDGDPHKFMVRKIRTMKDRMHDTWEDYAQELVDEAERNF
jgi:hypothetical protein